MAFHITAMLMSLNSTSHSILMIRRLLLTSRLVWQTFLAGWRTITFNSTLPRQNCLWFQQTHRFITIWFVLQRTFFQLPSVCTVMPHPFSVNSAVVTLTGHCTYSQSQKYIICMCFKALPVKSLIHVLVWCRLFLSPYILSVQTKKPV